MNKFFCCVLLFSIHSKAQKYCQEKTSKNPSELVLLSRYKTKIDTIGEKITVFFKDFELQQQRIGSSFSFFKKNKKLLSGDWATHDYLFQVYNSQYLIISYVNGKSGVASPETFPRDSLLIIDLDSGKAYTSSLKKVYLLASTRNFTESYYSERFYAIVAVNIPDNKIFLINNKKKEIDYPILETTDRW